MSGMASDEPMKRVYNSRDLSRQTAQVLNAVEAFGKVTIRSRTGKTYEIRMMGVEQKQCPSEKELEERFQDLGDRLAALGYSPPSEQAFQQLDDIIAGEV